MLKSLTDWKSLLPCYPTYVDRVGDLLGDLVGVLVTEVLRKFSDTLGDAARVKVASISTSWLNKGGHWWKQIVSHVLSSW